jgi:hypothetical protein
MHRSKKTASRASLLFLGFCLSALAQTAPPQANRISASPDPGPLQAVPGVMPAWVKPERRTSDEVDPTTPLRLTFVLRRAPEVQAAFEQLLADQQDPASPRYHHWLQPAEVGALYGPTQHDVQALAAWVRSQGLAVDSISPSRMAIEASAAAPTVAAALHTSFHLYRFGTKARRAPDSDPAIPAAFAPVVDTIHGLTDDQPVSAAHAIPAYTSGSGNHYVAPADFNLIYDVPAALSGAAIGSTAQHIAVIDTSDLVPADITDFAHNTGIVGYRLNTLWPVSDPGLGSEQIEATLDIVRTVGTAPGAISDLVVASNAQGGVYAAASYAVHTLNDPVLNISYISCEVLGGQSTVTQWNNLWSTAAAQGISVFVASGDSGAAGQGSNCDVDDAQAPTLQSLHVNAICSSQYATCVGATEFADTANPTFYWSSTNSSTRGSALSYIPEGAWNEPGTATPVVLATGGGASLYAPKPTWQTGTGVPADNARDTPDIAFSGSMHDGYYGCYNLNCESGSFEYFYGTSAAAPSMAGITALLNSYSGVRQGNVNPLIYRLAASPAASLIFHDTTIASSGVTNCSISTASMCNNSTPSPTSVTGGLAGYLLATGYDQATGWGSLDAANFIKAAVPVSTTLSLSFPTVITTVQSLTATATVHPASTSVTAPSGVVQFSINGTALTPAATISSSVANSSTIAITTPGSYTLTAIYPGDAYYTGSTATPIPFTVIVPPPGLTLTTGASFLTLTSGATTANTLPLTIGSTYGYTGAATPSCTVSSGTEAFPPSCLIAPGSVTLAANGTATAILTVTSTTAQSSLQSPGNASGALALAACALFFFRRRRIPALTVALIALCLIPTGCGNSKSITAPTTPRSSAGAYTVTIMASGTSTGASAPSFATASFALTIN